MPASPNREAREDAVLGEVLINNNLLSGGLEPGEADEDYALAKILQEQERAFLMLGRTAHAGAAENHPPAAGSVDSSGAAAGVGEEEGELDDEELARRLQEEEAAEHYRHMLAMAGVVPGEEEGELEFEDDPVDPDTMTYEELTALGEAVGTVSKGISAEQIAALPVQRYCEVAGQQAGEAACSDEQCAVCRLEYAQEDEVTVLPCNHYYHPECVGEWLKHNKVCPVCSKEVCSK